MHIVGYNGTTGTGQEGVTAMNQERSGRIQTVSLTDRKVLELAYMRQAFHALTEEDVQAMRARADAIREKWSHGEFFVLEDKEFHLTLFRPLQNQVLLSLLEAIWSVDDGFQLEKKQPHLEHTIARHEAIVEALERHSYPAFARAMDAHFSSGKYLGMTSYEEY